MSSDLVLLLIVVTGGAHLSFWIVLLTNLAYLRQPDRPSTSARPSLSVCIPARNEADNLRRLLPSLTRQNYPDLEIIVLDDNSTDDTWSVLEDTDDERVTALRGDGPPDGWVGKVHALYQCTRRASGEYYLFLDADAVLTDAQALTQLINRHLHRSTRVSSGFPHLRGGALLLVSLVPHALLRSLPWPLVRRTKAASLSALNGQCWLIDAPLYHELEPHERVKNAVLEDVEIGRYLKAAGHPPSLVDVQDLVSIYMYESFSDAWRGLRKNTYLLLGGTPLRFAGLYAGFLLTWVVAPFLSLWFLASLYGLKLVTDRASGMPFAVTLLAPISYVLALVLQLDSAVHHWIGRVTWKGRSVGLD